MKQNFKAIALIGVSLTSTLFLFQNCGPNKFQSVNTEALEMSSTAPSTTNSTQSIINNPGLSNLIPPTTSSNEQTSNLPSSGANSGSTNSSNSSGSSISTNTGAGNSGSVTSTPVNTTNKIISCGSVLTQLGWNANSFVRVDFLPADNAAPSANIEFAYDRFKIGFFAQTNQASFVERFKMDESGFAIKIRNKANGQSFQIPTSFFKPYASGSDIGSHGTASVMQVNNTNLARVNIDVSRTFYENYKNQLGQIEVELSCNGAAGPKATQDFRALTPDLDAQMHKSKYGGYVPDLSGFAGLKCVEEISSGGQIDCSVAGLAIDKIKWFADDVEYPNFSNLAAVKFSAVTTGLHSVQALVTYKDGSSGATLMRFIRVK